MNNEIIKNLSSVFGVDPIKIQYVLDNLLRPTAFVDALFDCFHSVSYNRMGLEDVQEFVDHWVEVAELDSTTEFEEYCWKMAREKRKEKGLVLDEN